MATIKSYTDLEQSKKLAEFLPLESADFGWNVFVDDTSRILPVNDWDLTKDGSGGVKFFHAWSLAALMKIIEIDKSEICFDCYSEKYRVNVHYQTLGSFCQDNELYESKIDALFAMVMKLHKRNIL